MAFSCIQDHNFLTSVFILVYLPPGLKKCYPLDMRKAVKVAQACLFADTCMLPADPPPPKSPIQTAQFMVYHCSFSPPLYRRTMGILQSNPLASQASQKTITLRWFPKTSWKGKSYSKVGRVTGNAMLPIVWCLFLIAKRK